MTLRRSRRAAAAVAVAAVLTLAAPAHAAGRHAWTTGPGWIEAVVQWIAGLWTGNAPERELKVGSVSDPGANGAVAPPAVETNLERGMGVDPDG